MNDAIVPHHESSPPYVSEPVFFACPPSTTGVDFTISGTQTVDEQHLVFSHTASDSFKPLLTLSLTKTGTQLAGDIGGAADAGSTFGPSSLEVDITDLPINYWHRAGANG